MKADPAFHLDQVRHPPRHLGLMNSPVADGWAYEWGETDVKFELSPGGPPVSLHSKGLRVLKRQSDGSWKFAVVVGNE